MTIHLPFDLESSIQAAVHSGRFASIDDAMAQAARLLLRQLNDAPADSPAPTDLGSIGAMRDAADELDEAMGYAMKLRQQPWRAPAGE